MWIWYLPGKSGIAQDHQTSIDRIQNNEKTNHRLQFSFHKWNFNQRFPNYSRYSRHFITHLTIIHLETHSHSKQDNPLYDTSLHGMTRLPLTSAQSAARGAAGNIGTRYAAQPTGWRKTISSGRRWPPPGRAISDARMGDRHGKSKAWLDWMGQSTSASSRLLRRTWRTRHGRHLRRHGSRPWLRRTTARFVFARAGAWPPPGWAQTRPHQYLDRWAGLQL